MDLIKARMVTPRMGSELTTGTEVPAGCLGLQGSSGPGSSLRRLRQNAHRWRLWFCADYVRRLSGCLLTFARPVETGTPPPKCTPPHALGWRWGESNPRPERLQLAGVTTIYSLWGHYPAGSRGRTTEQGPCNHTGRMHSSPSFRALLMRRLTR